MKRFLLVIYILLHSYYVNAQTTDYHTQVIYNMSYKPDTMNLSNTQKIEMELLLSDSSSLFQTLNGRRRDSILFFHNTQDNVFNKPARIIMRPVYKFAYTIIKRNESIDVHDSLFGSGMEGKNIIYHYKELTTDQKWTLMNDTLSLYGYVCQKAEMIYAGRKWIAWFAPDISIADGPYKFSNLPGLIVKVHDEKNHWTFEMVSLTRCKIAHVTNFQKWYTIQNKSKHDLYADRKQYEDNLPTIMQAENIPTEILDKLKLSIKNDNNWIELINSDRN